jgi:hypothetical protein
MEINKLYLGTIVDELLTYKGFDKLLIPSPWNLKLNQWRNIPKHDKFSVRNNKINCKYGKPLKEKEIELLQVELWKLFLSMNDIFSILRLAHSVFFLDNMEDIKPYWNNTELRKESALLDQISLYEIFGLSVKNYSLGDNIVEFQLKDITKMDPDLRLNDLIFLIRPSWYKTHKRFIILEYFDSYNNPIYILKIDTTKREDIFSLDVDEQLLTIDNLKECIEFTDLRK